MTCPDYRADVLFCQVYNRLSIGKRSAATRRTPATRQGPPILLITEKKAVTRRH